MMTGQISGAVTTMGDLVVLASSGDGDGSSFALLFLLSGFVFYGLMFLRYRNAHKRHKHESETSATLHDVKAQDEYVRSLRGVSNSKMSGANNTSVRGRLGGLF